MKRIGLLSDTHSYLDEALKIHFADCDEIWHAGDVGNLQVWQTLQSWKPCRGVFGNIDGQEIRWELPENQQFTIEGLRILMTHIGGKPFSYSTRVRKLLAEFQPHVLIVGHSHQVIVKKDPGFQNMVLINPGAAGREGFHRQRTAMRFTIESEKITNLELIQLGTR